MSSPPVVDRVEVAVVGGGPGGLAAAAMLKRRGMHPVVFERDALGSFWRGQYDRLHLHTIRWLSNLPGYHFPRSEGKWVSRDGVVRHLERYAAHYSLDVRVGVEVQPLTEQKGAGVAETSKGPIDAWAVVLATGYNLQPVKPNWPGVETFEGDLVLGSDYRRPQPYAGRNVLVVGTGNSGAEISVDLVEGGAAKVWLSYRTPPNVTVRDGPIPPPLLGMVLRALHVSTRNGDRLMAFLTRKLVSELATYGLPPATARRGNPDGAGRRNSRHRRRSHRHAPQRARSACASGRERRRVTGEPRRRDAATTRRRHRMRWLPSGPRAASGAPRSARAEWQATHVRRQRSRLGAANVLRRV